MMRRRRASGYSAYLESALVPAASRRRAVMLLRWLQTLARIVALTAALLVGADEADARVGGGLALASPAAPTPASLAAADGGLARRATLAQLPPAGGSLSD